MSVTERELIRGYSGEGARQIGWAILELVDGRRLGGLVSEATVAGGSFIRIDVCLPDDGERAEGQSTFIDVDDAPLKRIATQYHNAHAVDSIAPAARDRCLALTAGEQDAGHRWEGSE